MQARTRRWVAAVLLLAPACGGNGGGGPPARTLRLDADPDRSGRTYDDGTVLDLTMSANVLAPGDEASNRAERGVVSFLLAPLPPGATIDTATLDVEGRAAFGTPYADFGALVLDHVDLGAGLDGTDFHAGVLTPSYRTLPDFPGAGPPSPVSVDVRSAILADLAAGRPASSFRFQFDLAPSPDGEFDLVFITASPAAPLTLPHLTITYR
jgi:hypothetical protein